MNRIFNVSADCNSDLHYMVDISERLRKIKEMVDAGQYFTINRARQYGKTTTLQALGEYLKNDYVVISLDFQILGASKFRNENTFSVTFAQEFLDAIESMEDMISLEAVIHMQNALLTHRDEIELFELFKYLSKICAASSKPIVLIVDEVDSASNNQVFLDFLAQLRAYYIKRRKTPTFQSVILASVYDIKNIKSKIRMDEEHRYNSPWNIAADFNVDMSFSANDIEGMLKEYENDKHTGMNIKCVAQGIYDYTSGYPYLVSRICKLIDEQISTKDWGTAEKSAWNMEGIIEAVKIILTENNTLFDDINKKIVDYPELRRMLYAILFNGKSFPYNPNNSSISVGIMFGIIKNYYGQAVISNRIFETWFYNLFLSEELIGNYSYEAASESKNQFIKNGYLNMDLVMKKFMEHFTDVYGGNTNKFIEDNGRKLFLLYLKPIINGVGNYYIEAQTRDQRRTDVIVDYLGHQYIIEMKIWHGDEYNRRGEEQLVDYLNVYHASRGYLLSFNFNKKKEVGIKEIFYNNKSILEVVV